MPAGVLFFPKKNYWEKFSSSVSSFFTKVYCLSFLPCPQFLNIHCLLVSCEVQLTLSISIQCKLISLSLFMYACVGMCVHVHASLVHNLL